MTGILNDIMRALGLGTLGTGFVVPYRWFVEILVSAIAYVGNGCSPLCDYSGISGWQHDDCHVRKELQQGFDKSSQIEFKGVCGCAFCQALEKLKTEDAVELLTYVVWQPNKVKPARTGRLSRFLSNKVRIGKQAGEILQD